MGLELDDDERNETLTKIYESLMDIQGYITDIPGWSIIDCVQDDDRTMTLKCVLPEKSMLSYQKEVEKLEDLCNKIGVSINIVDSEKSTYDVIIYLSC